jgi:hypothetical protein
MFDLVKELMHKVQKDQPSKLDLRKSDKAEISYEYSSLT